MHIDLNKKLLLLLTQHELTLPEYAVLFGKVYQQKYLIDYFLNPEIKNCLQTKGYLTSSGAINKSGKQLVQSIVGQLTGGTLDTATFKSLFEKLWTTFPKTDAHGPHAATGLKRKNRLKCEQLAYSLYLKGTDLNKITELIKIDVENRIRQSTINNNALKYIQILENYLRDGAWEITENSVSSHSAKDTKDVIM